MLALAERFEAVFRLDAVPAVTATDAKPKMATDIPTAITTPDRVETRIGTLEFFDGFPTEETAQLVYDNLDFLRGMETFLTTIQAGSMEAVHRGYLDAGYERNGDIILTEQLMDAHSLFLTPNTESVYIMTWLSRK